MVRLGIVPLLAFLVFGLAIPFGAYSLSRRTGLPLLLAIAFAIGLGYGAMKADNPWFNSGLIANVVLMGASGVILLGYVALSVGAAKLVATMVSGWRS